jgi:hypothetical protein
MCLFLDRAVSRFRGRPGRAAAQAKTRAQLLLKRRGHAADTKRRSHRKL